jgi:hypothetical protein
MGSYKTAYGFSSMFYLPGYRLTRKKVRNTTNIRMFFTGKKDVIFDLLPTNLSTSIFKNFNSYPVLGEPLLTCHNVYFLDTTSQ